MQEGLKHAGPARASVRLEYVGGDLVLEVSDDGRGHGLLGMRERVALYGGEIDAGPLPAPAHGFVLRARLPIDGVVA